MKTKPIPALITLTAGFITCIVSFLNQVSMGTFVKNLCLVVVIFFVLGNVIRFVIERNFRDQVEEQAEETGQEEAEGTDGDAQPKDANQPKEKAEQE